MIRKFLFICAIIPLFSWATSTSTITRNVNVTDGFVEAGFAVGINGTQWELDEVYQGYDGIVNWYLTWDDDNLYLGKIGGNNTQGSVIYLRAEFTGASYANNTGSDYDGLQPDFSEMSGINFAAYFKNGYDEFKTFDGAVWSTTPNTLNDSYTSQADGDHMEISIAWNDITGGNGKPANLRAVMYQMDNASGNCTAESPNPFSYGESPWGTGNTNDGPNVGVNDGVGVSDRQPGGCGTANATIKRWWGCYPVIGGVSSNGWIAVEPNAGDDISICENETADMNGNEPAADALGTWAITSKPSGAPDPTFDDVNDKNTTVRNLVNYGEYVFEWNINYNNCPATPDYVSVFRYQNPPLSDAGDDVILDCGVDVLTLEANDPGPQVDGAGGAGTWSVAEGTGTFDDLGNRLTSVNDVAIGINKFVWTINNGLCDPTRDTVMIFRYTQPTSEAGIDQEICGTSATLAGNDPLVIQDSVKGEWQQFSGVTTVTFADSSVFNTNVFGLDSGWYEFAWILNNGNCLADTDTVAIMVYKEIVLESLSDISLCDSNVVSISATNPFLIQSSAEGRWKQLTGDSLGIADSLDYVLNLDSVGFDFYQFEWKVTNGVCPAFFDTVDVNIYRIPNAGNDSLIAICEETTEINLAGLDALSTQQTAQGYWTLSFGNNYSFEDSLSFNTLVSNLDTGSYNFIWIVNNGVCETDTASFEINISKSVASAAGLDVEGCAIDAVNLSANNPSTIQNSATGKWSFAKGNGLFDQDENYNASVSQLSYGENIMVWSVSNGACAAASDSISIINYQPPVADAGNDAVFCEPIIMNANNPLDIIPSGNGVWSLLDGSTEVTYDDVNAFNTVISTDGNNAGDTYKFLWTISNGLCPSVSDEVTFERIEVLSNGATTSATDYPDNNGMVTISLPSGGSEPYLYSVDIFGLAVTDADTNNVFKGLPAGTYNAVVVDQVGCSDTLTFEIKQNLFISTGFSPNGDGTNDTWGIIGSEDYPELKITIFNAWGGIVFESDGYSIAWDGTRKGNPLPDGTYYYILEKGDGTDAEKGSIMLLR